MNSKNKFVEAVLALGGEADAQSTIESYITECLNIWGGPPNWLGMPDEALIENLSSSSQISIFHIIWPPHFITEPHNHNMWATIGLYCGRENNILWERTEDSIRPIGAKTIAAGETISLNQSSIHSVHNPLDEFTGAIHVYGGDFLGADRSEWDPKSLEERPRELSRMSFPSG